MEREGSRREKGHGGGGVMEGEAGEDKWMNEHGLFQNKQQFCELHVDQIQLSRRCRRLRC